MTSSSLSILIDSYVITTSPSIDSTILSPYFHDLSSKNNVFEIGDLHATTTYILIDVITSIAYHASIITTLAIYCSIFYDISFSSTSNTKSLPSLVAPRFTLSTLILPPSFISMATPSACIQKIKNDQLKDVEIEGQKLVIKKSRQIKSVGPRFQLVRFTPLIGSSNNNSS